jgi:hypothetical protein
MTVHSSHRLEQKSVISPAPASADDHFTGEAAFEDMTGPADSAFFGSKDIQAAGEAFAGTEAP